MYMSMRLLEMINVDCGVEASQWSAHPCLSRLACGNDDGAPGAPHLACA
jgi:hypothetical protein